MSSLSPGLRPGCPRNTGANAVTNRELNTRRKSRFKGVNFGCPLPRNGEKSHGAFTRSPPPRGAAIFFLKQFGLTSVRSFANHENMETESKTNHNGSQNSLPTPEIAYAYAIAMYFAQKFELNLRAILYTADYHDWGEQIKLDQRQSEKFQDVDRFIDKATCGDLINKLRATNTIKGSRTKSAFGAFARSCTHRNKLAHSFLAEHNFEGMNEEAEKKLLHQLYTMTLDLWEAFRISKAVREQAEYFADENQEILSELFVEETKYENPNRHYATRKRK